MLAFQFSAKMYKNTIKVPSEYKGFNDKTVQVIIMQEEIIPENLAKFAGKIHLREEPLRYQRRKRDEWK